MLREIKSKLEEMDNKLERIKSDTNNLSRIASLSNSPLIVEELRKLIGKSELKAVVLHLTQEEITSGELAKQLGIDQRNLNKFISPFLGNKGYIAELRRGGKTFFQRSELVDLIGFENIPEFAELIASWKTKKDSGKTME